MNKAALEAEYNRQYDEFRKVLNVDCKELDFEKLHKCCGVLEGFLLALKTMGYTVVDGKVTEMEGK